MTVKKGLGRGLSALFGDDEEALATTADTTSHTPNAVTTRVVPVSHLEPCPFQPRRHFDSQSLGELAESLKAHGVLQPLLVRPNARKPGTYEIVAGERRWRASQKAGLHELPVVVRELSDRAVLEIGLIENLQRDNLQPLEEAETYKRLVEEHDYTQDDLAQVIGRSRSHIANMMRLLALPDAIKSYLMTGKITAGHARALLTASDPAALAARIVREGLSVRETERLAGLAAVERKDKTPQSTLRNANIGALEDKIANLLGWRVKLDAKKDGSGKVVIAYKSLDQLDELLRRFGA